MKLLIIQPDCRSYRVPFFNALQEKIGPFTLAHQDEFKFQNNSNITEVNFETYEYFGFKYVKKLKRLIKEYDSIVVGYDIHWLNLIALPIVSSKKIIVWGHGPGKQALLHPLKKIIANKSKSVITYSLAGKEAVENIGVDKDKIYIATNTLHVNNAENTSVYKKKSFVFLGRLQERKKLSLFFEAYKKAKLNDKNIEITIIGDGEVEKKALIEKAKQLDIINKVQFIEGTSNNEVLIKYFKSAYAYVSPGAVGLGLLHSFAFGVPVITMADSLHGPEIMHLKNGETGYLINSQAEFSYYLEKVITNHKFLGNNAYLHYKENASIQAMVNGFVNAIQHSQV